MAQLRLPWDALGLQSMVVLAQMASEHVMKKTLSCDMPTSTHVGELRRAARCRSTRACRECWLERLLRQAGEVGVSELHLGVRSSMR